MSAKPVVYFIDDSATMREVIKIAFRREDLDVITCHDASSAMDMMDHSAPDVVISDVIMPGHDGYEVCQYIKQHPRFGQTPVILMSGVVNKGVAERAFAVHANELIRKPFQPQDLIARVRHLLKTPVEAEVSSTQAQEDASAVLSSIFSGPMPSRAGSYGPPRVTGPVPVPPRLNSRPPSNSPSIAATVAAALQPSVLAAPVSIPGAQITGAAQISVPPPQPGRVPPPPIAGNSSDGGRMRLEILRLHSQIKKLELELVAEREYTKALEEHVNTLAEID
jgi:CheY-like chemotaxis protein